MKNGWRRISLILSSVLLLTLALVSAAQGSGTETEEAAPTSVESLPDIGLEGNRDTLLPATMVVTTTTTRNTMDKSTLAGTFSTASRGQEISTDLKLSSMGPSGDADYDALTPAVAYNSDNNQYLVVWSGSEDTIGEYEIWGQRVDAANGGQISAEFQISYMGPADDPDYDAEVPAVVYNSESSEYLVMWSGDHYAEGDFEIFAQRVNATTDALIGSMVRVSVMGPGVDPDYDAKNPAVAYNSKDNQYLVVWEGDDDTAPQVNEEFEIWGKWLNSMAEWLDANQFLISNMGGSGDAAYDAFAPGVAYNSSDNQYMVVWYGDDNFFGVANDEYEIWGQRLNASGGEMGAGDFRISDMGPDNDANNDALDPAIAYNSTSNQYLVVWEGEDSTENMYDIFGQRLEANGISVGANDFYVTDTVSGPNEDYDALNPAVAYDQANNEYLVVWQDDELGVGEFEIWGQQVNAVTGLWIGSNTRLSDMGPDEDADNDAQLPTVAYTQVSHNQYLVAWSGDDSTDDEFEIWYQRFSGGCKVYLPAVKRE